MSSDAVPPMRTSPISPPPRGGLLGSGVLGSGVRGGGRERLGHDLQADAARALDQHDVAGLHDVAGEPGGGRSIPHRVHLALEASAHLRRQRAHGDQHVHSRRGRIRADLAVVPALVGAELEHVAEHGDAAPCGLLQREIVQGGAHRERIGVVAVVDDDRAAREHHVLATQRREAHVDAALRRARRRPAPQPPRPACCGGCGRRRTAARAPGARRPPGSCTRRWSGACRRRRRWRRRAASAVRARRRRPARTARPRAPGAATAAAAPRRRAPPRSRASRRPTSSSPLALRDPLQRADLLDVHRADRRDHADVGLRDRGQLGDLPEPAHPHLQHEDLGARRRAPGRPAAARSRCCSSPGWRRPSGAGRSAPRSGPSSTSCRPSR